MRKFCAIILLFSVLICPLSSFAADGEGDNCCRHWSSLSKTSKALSVGLLVSLGVLGVSIYGLVWCDQTQQPACGVVIDGQDLFDNPVCVNASQLGPPFIFDAFGRVGPSNFYNGSYSYCSGELSQCCQQDNSSPMCLVLNLPDKSLVVTKPHLVNKNDGVFGASIVGAVLGGSTTVLTGVLLGIFLCS